jgi:L-threonylcarbamoyladenylate synthase
MSVSIAVEPNLLAHYANPLAVLSQHYEVVSSADVSISPRFTIDGAFTLRFALELPHRVERQVTLLFHTPEELVSFILEHPEPQSEYPYIVREYGSALRRGGVVAFPTETVYGLGADATNEEAVKRIFTAKERPLFDPLIVHVADLAQLETVAESIDWRARALIGRFWPGPLTLVVKKHPSIPDIVTSGGDTVAIRMPDNPFALSLIAESERAIAAPSANRFGYTSPTTASHVKQQLGERIDGVLDGGACAVGIESTVLSLVSERPTILRPGMIGPAQLEPLIGKVVFGSATHHGVDLESPGLLENHYAPTTPLYLVEDVTKYRDNPEVGVLLFERSNQSFAGPVRYISESEDPREAARRLYWAMRQLDELGLRMMVCSLLTEEGIGVAINNRLRKASHKG